MSTLAIQLTSDQALVLFELLAREEERLPYQHDAERAVIWQIQAQLEKSLVAPLEPDYAERLREARNRIESDR